MQRSMTLHQTSIARKNISAASNRRNGSSQCHGYRNALAENWDGENTSKWAHVVQRKYLTCGWINGTDTDKTSDIGNVGKHLPVVLRSGLHDWRACHYAGD